MNLLSLFVLALVPGSNPPGLEIESAHVKLGKFHANKPLVQTFQLCNATRETLTMGEVTGGCGCFKYHFEPREVPPGTKSTLTITLNTLALPAGPGKWAFRVNAQGKTAIHNRDLLIEGDLQKEVSIEPVALALIGAKNLTSQLTLTDRSDKKMTITQLTTSLKGLSATALGETDPTTAQTTIQVKVADTLAPGTYTDEILIETNHDVYRQFKIPVRIVKRAATAVVEFSPESPSVRFASEQKTASVLVRLRHSADESVIVESARCDHPGLTCKWVEGPDKMSTVRVNIDRALAGRTGRATLIVSMKTPLGELLSIPISWSSPKEDR